MDSLPTVGIITRFAQFNFRIHEWVGQFNEFCPLLSVRARHPPLLKASRIHLSSAEECVQRTGIGAQRKFQKSRKEKCTPWSVRIVKVDEQNPRHVLCLYYQPLRSKFSKKKKHKNKPLRERDSYIHGTCTYMCNRRLNVYHPYPSDYPPRYFSGGYGTKGDDAILNNPVLLISTGFFTQ